MNLKVPAPLDPGFMPMSVIFRDFESAVKLIGGEPMTVGLERNDGLTSVFSFEVYKDGTGHDEENYEFVERVIKTLLWTRGGYRIIIAGSALIADRIKAIKAESGPDALAGLSSARCSNEDNYVFQKMMRAAIGTNNVDHCARL